MTQHVGNMPTPIDRETNKCGNERCVHLQHSQPGHGALETIYFCLAVAVSQSVGEVKRNKVKISGTRKSKILSKGVN